MSANVNGGVKNYSYGSVNGSMYTRVGTRRVEFRDVHFRMGKK